MFHPHTSAQRNQRTCNGKCREKRKRLLAKRRRERDLQDHRVEERKRQRKHRKRLQGGKAVPYADSLEVSRAGLSPQATVIEEVILKNWDKLSRLSRASLRRDLHVLLNFSE
jgi:hypothetical protein